MTSMHSLAARTKLFGLMLAVGVLFVELLAAPLAHAQCATPSTTFGACAVSTSASTSQAGAHADFSTSFDLNTNALGNPVGQLKDVTVNLPPGEVGNPQAIPKCTDNDFQDYNCPADSQVGTLNATFVTAPGSQTSLTQANLAPTTLTSTVAPCSGLCDEVTFTVTSASGINSGDFLTICGVTTAPCDTQVGGQAEHLTVINVSGNSITALTAGPVQSTCGPDMSLPTNTSYCPLSGIFYTHDAGDLVYDDTITVGNTAGFEGYAGGNSITIGTSGSADYESDTVAFYPGSSTQLDLSNPLQHVHASGESVIHLASTESAPIPLFNMQPDPGHVATLSATFLIATIVIEVDVHSPGGDTNCDSSTCGLTATLSYASSLLTLEGSSITLWGVPGDPSHDSQRCGELGDSCQPTAVSKAPFMTSPTSCSGPLTTTVTVDSYENQSATSTATQAAPTGCNLLSIAPTLSVGPDTSQADTPAGYDVDLGVPQNTQPYSLATPSLQNVTMTLPAGTALSPATANGLQGCTDAQFAADSCPDASKVGTVSIASPLLPDHLVGWAYIGSPTPSQMYRLFLIASADNVTIKLSGQIQANASTGQLTVAFDQNPPLPFSDLNVSLFSGPLAPLANPESCGTFTTTSDISSYSAPGSGPDATPSSSFDITGCTTPTPFAPTFTAGTTNPTAGAYSPFTLTFSRQDTDQELSSITATLPPGLFADVGSVPLCSDADASAGTCSSASQVGTATVGSGAGAHPLFLSGQVYLTGPYNGGAYGLATVVPAVAGPYNLGTVVVRQSLRINPSNAQVTAVSDPFPTILDGVPLRIKTISLALNRPNFIVNPTSCSPQQITGTITSVGGASEAVSSPFQVGSCQELPFFPSLGIKLTGKGQTTSGKHPTLIAALKEPAGQANLASAKVTLPLSLALDPTNSNVVCPYAVAQAVHGGAVGCPTDTIVGSATAISPLLSKPLTGPVYLVQGIRFNKQGEQIRTLPTLLLPLRGQIALDLRATTSVNGAGQLVSTFSGIPDAAVSSFNLTINGGSKGILVITGRGRNICSARQTAGVTLGAHSGKLDSFNINVARPCAGTTKDKSHRTKKSKRKSR